MDTNRHVVVISEDALVYDDLETLRQLPAFGELMKNGSDGVK